MKIKGSFVQGWYCEKFDSARWNAEFAAMKACGMDLLIVADHKFNLPYVKRILAAAGANEMTVCLGTGEFPQWWKHGGQKQLIVTEFKKTAAQCVELYRLLSDEERAALFGWYFVPEISSARGLGYSPYLMKAMNLLIDRLKETDPALPLMLSPYYTEFLAKSMDCCRKDWVRILREVHFRPQDILCPQDAIGAGWTRVETLPAAMEMYQSALQESGRDIRFWLNCEDFVQSHNGTIFMPKRTENRGFCPCGIRRFAWQLEQAQKYTETVITFSYNHYHSPFVVHPDYDRALRQYLSTGTLAENDFSMSGGRLTEQPDGVFFSYDPIETDWAVQAVKVYRLKKDGEQVFVGRADRPQGPKAELPSSIRLNSHKKGTYLAIAEDVWGNLSKPFSFTI